MKRAVVLASAMLLLGSLPSQGQSLGNPGGGNPESHPATDEPGPRQLTIGGVTLIPALVLSTGLDTNVFNTPDRPRRDFTWTLAPRTGVRIQLGPAQLDSTVSVQFVRFQRIATESSINVDGSARLGLKSTRLQPFVSTSFLRTRERPSFEIDSRPERVERSLALGVTGRLSTITTLELAGTTGEVAFDADAVAFGTSLRDLLDRNTRMVGLSLRHQLTPVTTVAMAADAIEERFTFSRSRDSRGLRLASGVEFARSAVVTGSATVGYRTLAMRSASAPRFSGMLASVSLAHTVIGSTRLEFQAGRDVAYSGEVAAPYYVQSSLGGIVTRQLTDSLSVTARASRHRLSFRHLVSDSGSRVDEVLFSGGGVIWRIGRARLSVGADYVRRRSPLTLREYRRLQAGSSVAYGL